MPWRSFAFEVPNAATVQASSLRYQESASQRGLVEMSAKGSSPVGIYSCRLSILRLNIQPTDTNLSRCAYCMRVSSVSEILQLLATQEQHS